MMLFRPCGSSSVSWSWRRSYQLGLTRGEWLRCSAVPGVQATTMPDGNAREHDGHHRQGHGFGGEDAPARRAHGEIVLTPRRGVKAAMNVPTMPRQVCPGTLLAGLAVAAKQARAMSSMNARLHAWSRFPSQCCAKGGFVLVSRSMSGGLR